MIFLLISILDLSCSSKVYTSTEIEGDYKEYSTKYFGLLNYKTNAIYSFGKDSIYTFQGCNYVEGKWYVQGDILYLIDSFEDANGVKNICTLPYKITKNKIQFKKEYYINGNKYTDTTNRNEVLIRIK